MVLSIQVANVVLTTVVADQSEARNQSPEAVAKMALASDVVVVQVSRQLPKPRGRFTVNGSKEGCTVLDKGKAATVREGNAAAVSIGKFMNPVLLDMCRCKPCLQRSRVTLVTRREPSSRRPPQGNAAPTTVLRYH